jgi:transposase
MLGDLMTPPPTPPKQPLPKSNNLTIMAQEKAWELYNGQNMSMQQVANALNKSKSNIQKLINGKKLRIEWEEYEKKKKEYDRSKNKPVEIKQKKEEEKPINTDITKEEVKPNNNLLKETKMEEPELLKIKADTNIRQMSFDEVIEDINKNYTKVTIIPPQTDDVPSTINDEIEGEKSLQEKILENKNIILISLVAVAIIGGGIYYFMVYKKRQKTEEDKATNPNTPIPTTPEETDTSDIPAHDNAKWVVIGGEKIPRGENIL